MTKTAKTKTIDPTAAVRSALMDGVDTMIANNTKFAEQAQTEVAKAKTAAADQAAKVQAAVQANIDATTAAGQIVAAGAEQASVLVQDEMTKLVDGRTAALKTVIGATSLQDAFAAQIALIQSEQAQAKALFGAFTKLGQSVANDALKPVQAQIAENMKAINLNVA